MRINQNIAAFNAQRNLTQTQGHLNSSLEKLSSGFRINRAADDAAGLVNSENLRAQIGGLGQAQSNAQDAISLIQTAEGAQTEVHASLQRIRDLVVATGNTGTNDSEAVSANQNEIDQLIAELDRVAGETQYGTQKILDGSADGDDGGSSLTFQVGANAGQTVSLDIASVKAEDMGVTLQDSADADVGTGLAGLVGYFVDDGTDGGFDLNDRVEQALGSLDAAISGVSENRGELGAMQNRMDATVRNLSVAEENLAAAESRIRDTDMANEMVDFTRHQILQQAGTAMLAQANQMPQSVLSLLG